MAYRTDEVSHDVEDEAYEIKRDEPKHRRVLSRILILALLVGSGSASAMAWRAFRGGPVSTPTPTSIATADKVVGQADLEAIQNQIAASVQSTEKLLATQQAELKRLADQVTALSDKLEILQPTEPAEAAPAETLPKRAVPPKSARAGGPVSTGGAPVQPSR